MTLEQLENLIAQRSSAPSGESWTAHLLGKGPEKCAEKFGEEAIELIIEACDRGFKPSDPFSKCPYPLV